jgi:type VII secretion-associated serine protease mycosin
VIGAPDGRSPVRPVKAAVTRPVEDAVARPVKDALARPVKDAVARPVSAGAAARPVTVAVLRPFAAAFAALVIVLVSAAPARADAIRDDEWWLKTLDVAQAQRITKGAGVTVAVVDSGVNAQHPDLRGAVLAGHNSVSGADGRSDTDGHGTAMAGIIAARGRGGSGLLGIAPDAKILPVRPSNDTFFAAQGIRWAASHGAKVINLSFAIAGSDNLHAAIREAAAADVVLIGAAGNSGDKGNAAEYPVSYPEVLGVGAIDPKGKVLTFSQHGPQVDIVAPGIDMPTAGLGDQYRTGYGTSQAAAVVSGAAALIRAKHPDYTAAQVVEVLTATATDKGDKGRDDYYGSGELDLVKALTADVPQPSPTGGPAVTDAPAAARTLPSDDGDGGVSPLLIVGAGVIILIGAVLIAVVALRRRQER